MRRAVQGLAGNDMRGSDFSELRESFRGTKLLPGRHQGRSNSSKHGIGPKRGDFEARGPFRT